MDDEFAKKMGFEDLAKLKDMVKERMSGEFAQMTNMKLKRDVLDALDKMYTFELPEKLVDSEFKGIWNALTQEMTRAGKSFADENTTEEDARKEYRAIAERRVRLGLVLGTMGEKEGVQVGEQELQQALFEPHAPVPRPGKAGGRLLPQEPRRHDGTPWTDLRAEGRRRIVAKATVTEKTVTKEELQAMVQDEDESIGSLMALSHDDHEGHDHA
jgi:trigger factor